MLHRQVHAFEIQEYPFDLLATGVPAHAAIALGHQWQEMTMGSGVARRALPAA